jgi:hypothetical protein
VFFNFSHLHPSLIFEVKASRPPLSRLQPCLHNKTRVEVTQLLNTPAYLGVELIMVALCFILLERLARDKRSSLFCRGQEKRFYNIDPRWSTISPTRKWPRPSDETTSAFQPPTRPDSLTRLVYRSLGPVL